MKKQIQTGNLTIQVKDKNNCQIIQFQVPFNTGMKKINQILWQNKIQFESNKQKLIGFQTLSQDPLLDFRLCKEIGNLKNNLIIKPFYKNTKLQGLNKYKLLKCLATGGFSKVYLARSLQNGQFYAAKFVDKLKVPTQDKKILIMNEKKVNQIADYSFLVKMHQFIQTQNFYVFIMDYCPGGQLFFLLRSVKRMTEEQARIYFVQILLGIQYLHKQGIMYRDLKPQNIMIDETGHVKIADFGLAKFFRQKSYSFCGSIQYMSPQIVTNAGHSFQVDYYCLGALLFQLLIGCPPFYDPQLSQYETKKNIAYAQVEFPQDYGLSNQVKDLIEKLLVKNPNQRLGHFGGAKQIMLHPWIGKVNRSYIESKKFDIPFPPNLAKFNFDPDQVGMSEERFTNKIHNQYRLINSIHNLNMKKQRKQTFDKQRISREKSTSPYRKKLSQSHKKNDCRKSAQGSLTNLLSTKTSSTSYVNLKTLVSHDLTKFSTKKKLSKNKSPSFISVNKKQQNGQNYFKTHAFMTHKLYNMKTEISQNHNQYSLNNNKLMKKKKITTESNDLMKDISNSFMKSPKKMDKREINFDKIQLYKKEQSNEKRQSGHKREKAQNGEIDQKRQSIQNVSKPSNLLKKSSKLKIKKMFNENGQRNLDQYGKQYRQTCIV